MNGNVHFGDHIEVNGQNNIGKITYQSASETAGYRELAAALRTDAATAPGVDGHTARGYADDLEEALAAGDATRIDRVLARIKGFLDVAGSAFALSRGLPPLDG